MSSQITDLEKVSAEQMLEAFGAEDQVRMVLDRLMFARPEAPEVGRKGMALLAQAAYFSGANLAAESGEIYIWKDRKNPLGATVYLGINYWRRKARENGEALHFVYDVDTNERQEPRPMTDEEKAKHGVEGYAYASICKAYRAKDYHRLLDKGVPWAVAQNQCAITGIGVIEHTELKTYNGKDRSAPKGRSWQWVANKRAERDAMTKTMVIASSVADVDVQLQARFNEAAKKLAHGVDTLQAVKADPKDRPTLPAGSTVVDSSAETAAPAAAPVIPTERGEVTRDMVAPPLESEAAYLDRVNQELFG